MKMKVLNRFITNLKYGLLVSGLTACAGISHAGTLNLSDVPLFLVNSVEPNVFFTIDDSGSMEAEVLIEGNDEGIGLFDEDGDTVIDGDGRFYVLPASNNASEIYYPTHGYFLFTISNEDLNPGIGLWRYKSSDYNRSYYNPEVRYSPWQGSTTTYANSPPAAAPVDPRAPSGDKMNLTADLTYVGARLPVAYFEYITIFPATHYQWTDTDADGVVDRNDAFTRIEIKPATTSYARSANRTDCVSSTTTCSYSEEIQNFANWFTYYRKRSYLAQASIGAVVENSSGIRVGQRYFNSGHAQDVVSMSTLANKQAFQDILYAKTFSAATPARAALGDTGEYFRGQTTTGSSAVPILSSALGGTCQQNFNVVVSDGYWNGTLSAAQYTRYGDDDSDGDTAFDGGNYEDETLTAAEILNGEIVEHTLADISMYYYENDLNTLLADRVPTLAGVDEAEHQHLITYGVALGAVGDLDPEGTKNSSASDTDPTDSNFEWPGVISNTSSTIDDLWHAAYNGRGDFLNASDAVEFLDALNNVFGDVADRTSSSSSVALSSGFLNSSSLLFQARFDSTEWTGQLFAYSVISSGASAGSVGALQWNAACELDGGTCAATGTTSTGLNWNTGRVILTSTPPTSSNNGTGVKFRWPTNPASPTSSEITTAQVAALKVDPDGGAATANSDGENRLNFVRGSAISGMRSRGSMLGDIVDSNPSYVGPPSFTYPDSLETPAYSAFATSYASRTPVIYVGANDGMLHGFNGTSGSNGGKELIAYVPSEVYGELPSLTSTNYGGSISHRYYVNGTPTSGDVVVGGAWRTILVGGLGKGGQGIFALNVTNPTNFTEANASSLVMWEFTDAVDEDLGFTYGQPAIIRMHNGAWGVVVGNGYNNTDTNSGADTAVSSDGDAQIYILDVSDGSIIKKFDTKVGTAEDPTGASRPNGIGTITPVDVDGDHIVDYLYAPDLFGNVWKIDLGASNTNQWDFSFKQGSNPEPFFIAKDSSGNELPITSAIDVGLHAIDVGQILYFGTGQYLESADLNLPASQTQTFFGVWDRNEASNQLSVITRSHLLQQTIDEEVPYVSGTDDDLRISSTHLMSWYASSGLPGNPSNNGYLGWYMDLYNTEGGVTDGLANGERVISDPLLRDGKIIFVTLLPSASPCDFGGTSWLMELDADSGGRLDIAPFDLNGDGLFTSSDYAASSSGDSVPPSGRKSDVGILPTPGILKSAGSGTEYKYFSGSTGGIQSVTENRGTAGTGRQSWRQIFD